MYKIISDGSCDQNPNLPKMMLKMYLLMFLQMANITKGN
jgi:hypothetical protein